MELILGLAKGFGRLYTEDFNGFLIGKAKVEFLGGGKADYTNSIGEIIKDSIKYKRCTSCLLDGKDVLCKAELILLKKKTKKSDIEEYNGEIEGENFFTIDKNEVNEFSKSTGDKNEIHISDNPIVQGMLIIKHLDKYFKCIKKGYSTIEVRFITPLYANENTNIVVEENEFKLYKKNILVLKGRIE